MYSPAKSHGAATLYIQYPVWIATLWATPASWLSNVMVKGRCACTERQSVENRKSLATRERVSPEGAQDGVGGLGAGPTARVVRPHPAKPQPRVSAPPRPPC